MDEEPEFTEAFERYGDGHVAEPERGLNGPPGRGPIRRRARTSRHTTDPAARVRRRREPLARPSSLPQLITVDDAAAFLCTSRCAIYAMLERGQLPPPIRIGRRVLLLQDELLDWLHQKRAPSLQE